ncbi:hypothetical protein COCMIDRAFT_36455 [Bipolaris oryzae ATCC 44560]|uniref:Uncharacterized protein n=1 Tax=Bipolaris oryzae ATCC 44560 TaxID=930090 RepID=W6Z275_COCMI|nr:uncharacterized protein COCMIDRAFT_36455 [Bipolaris oryzae ATCC 44560]EUC45852.1 hypothetical protein COCMIDRAFT_36455 [Bipolaris oryzae ATCC 44560]
MHRGMIDLGLPAILDSPPLLDSSRDTPRAAWRPLVAVLASRVSYSDNTSRPALDRQCNQRRGGAGLVHGANTTYASTYREVMRHQIDMAGSQD